jgi:dihydrofolate reductase/thymidylate synthase
MKKFSIVVAAENSLGIGLNNTLPWPKLSHDLAHFKKITSSAMENKRNVVIMGRKTWYSIPNGFRPLSDRFNIVLTRDEKNVNSIMSGYGPDSVRVEKSLQSALEYANALDNIDKIFVIGGEQLFFEAIKHPLCEFIYFTKVMGDFQCDKFFPRINPNVFKEQEYSDNIIYEDNGVKYQFNLFKRVEPRHEEYQYLDIVREIIEEGNEKGDRTGVGTFSKFGCQMRFSLRDGRFPLLTTKRVFWRGVAEELLWFIAGHTNANLLQEKGIHIWDGNGSRKYLDSIGLNHREEMDLGPVYGFQWRHWGAKYIDMHTDYTNKGFDQLADCIDKIKNNPTDRRIVMSAWNPSDLKEMALAPCHLLCQFYVANGELSCQMYQRSCDMGLGVPFNIASYALLTCMVAHVCGLKPGEFVHVLGDAHVYKNHVEALKQQLNREPREFPILRIKRNVTDIDDFKFEDFEIIGYNPHGTIKMDMAL